MALAFVSSEPLTLGVELELQIVDRRSCNLTRGASDLLAALDFFEHRGEIKPERTESMIEVATGVARSTDELCTDLASIHSALAAAARAMNLGLCGGGAHPLQEWRERRIDDAPRRRRVSELYGYLARQFTVFGQHVHIGCPGGDTAVWLARALGRFVPHMIALSASSPFQQGVDTLFDSARSNAVSAFPLSGTMPPFESWRDFEAYFEAMRGHGIVDGTEDFSWDIRPSPGCGTVEICVFDTPLTLRRAVALAGYAQALAACLMEGWCSPDLESLERIYSYNRFQACRFGLDAMLVDPDTGASIDIQDDLLETLERVAPVAETLGSGDAIQELHHLALTRRNDASSMREEHEHRGTLGDVVRWQCDSFSDATKLRSVRRRQADPVDLQWGPPR